MQYKGYDIVESSGHGKCVKGQKKTSSIQVRKPCGEGYLLQKQITFPVGDFEKKNKALEKAKQFVDQKIEENGSNNNG